MKNSKIYVWTALFVSLALLLATMLPAQVTIKKVPIKPTTVAAGGEMFVAYCAACHGEDGKGAGPASPALKQTAPDLTQLSKHNNGVFPSRDVFGALDQPRGVHGTSDMPIWGQIFRESQGRDNATLRLYNLMRYIEFMQETEGGAAQPAAAGQTKSAQSPPPSDEVVPITRIYAGSGSVMYQTFCASCHGVDGRGAGPLAVMLNSPPADLTLMKQRNGGKYPAFKILNLLGSGPGAKAHGTAEMPVWGDAFRARGEDQNIVRLRLTNLTNYLERLQR